MAGHLSAADAPSDIGCEYFPMLRGQVYEILGDSISGPHEIFPLIQKAFPARDLWYLNASFGGNTLRDAIGRLDRDALRTDLGPDRDVNWYITMFGANDASLFDATGFEANCRRMIETLKRRTRAHLILVATPCFTQGAGKTANKRLGEFADVVRALGAEYGIATVDLYHPSLDWAAKNGEPAFAKDGIHPSPEAHAFMAQTFLKPFNFYDLAEQIDVDLGGSKPKATGTEGCDATIQTDGVASFTLMLANRWDFGRRIGLVLHGAGSRDIYDDAGAKLEAKDGRAIVTLPDPCGLITTDLDTIRNAREASADAKRLAGEIQEDVKRSRALRLRLVPQGTTVAAMRLVPMQIFARALDLAKAERTLPEAQRFLDQFTDLRVNFPKERLPRAQNFAGRDCYGITRMGDAASRPVERFEAVFVNLDAPSASGEIRVASLPATGWSAKAVTPAAFTNLARGARFTCEFELTGEETCTWQGDMTVAVGFKLNGTPQPAKQAVVRLFSPWLGVGTFCDTKETEAASVKEKFDVPYPPEKGVDPKAVFTRFDGKEIRWKPFRSFYSHPGIDRSGEIWWNKNGMGSREGEYVFAPWQPPGVLYAAKWVFSPDDRDVKLLPVFSSRAAKMWLNGALVIDAINPDEKAWNENAYGMNWTAWSKTEYYVRKTVDARLVKGWNPILFKLVSNSRAWDGADILDLKIFDAKGNSYTDLLGSCVPPRGQ